MQYSEEIKKAYVEQALKNIEDLDPELNPEEIKARIEARVEGMVSKAITDQIMLVAKDRIEEIVSDPKFKDQVRELTLEVIKNMTQITFRKI
jgi:hypothetical protein